LSEISIPFRLVLHEVTSATAISPGVSHGDLFFLGDQSLVTYEISAEDLLQLASLRGLRIRAQLDEGGILIVRKADHRMLYWEYEGPISNDRGSIRELLRGELDSRPDEWSAGLRLKFYDARAEAEG